MPRQFARPASPRSEHCQTAHNILCEEADACEAFHQIFSQLRTDAGRGTTTDQQQDTLRAMLVFSCAGLDSAVKQLVRDALSSVIDKDLGAEKNFTESVRRKMPDIEKSNDLLASVLTARDPRMSLIQRIMNDLLADSLQSVAQLAKVASAFNVGFAQVSSSAELKEAFEARNQIIHEMDIDFRANRSRRSRRKADMERLTTKVLSTGAAFLQQVDSKLAN